MRRRSPLRLQRISVGTTVVREPSVTTLALTRSSIEAIFWPPIGQPNACPGTSKPFLVAQPAPSAVARTAAGTHAYFILRPPLFVFPGDTRKADFPAAKSLSLRGVP